MLLASFSLVQRTKTNKTVIPEATRLAFHTIALSKDDRCRHRPK
jgi:hypothetical protein